MSHDVLDGLRRRLVALRGIERTERPATGAASTDSGTPTSLVADGGDRSERGDDEHLRDLPDGAGCTEIWEHLSEQQADEGKAGDGNAGERPQPECQADD